MFVVAGSTGNTGSVVAQTLLARGQRVRVLTREAHKAAALKERGAEVVEVSLEQPEALASALAGARGAYLLVPPNFAVADVLGTQSRLIASLSQAVRSARVEHVVLLSSIAAQHPEGTGPIRIVHEAERVLADAAPHVTFLRAGYFMENFAASLGQLGEGVLPTFLEPARKLPMIATVDIGTTAASELIEGGRGRSIVELGGPELYSVNDAARELSDLLGAEITVRRDPEQAAVSVYESFGLPRGAAELFAELMHGLNSGHVAWEGGAARSLRGQTTLRAVLARLVGRAS